MKIKILFFFAVIVLSACAGSSSKDQQAATEKEVVKEETLTKEIESASVELEESISKVDSLVHEL